MSDGEVRLERDGAIAHVTFDRPAARNAMTWHMYQQLGEICSALRADTAGLTGNDVPIIHSGDTLVVP